LQGGIGILASISGAEAKKLITRLLILAVSQRFSSRIAASKRARATAVHSLVYERAVESAQRQPANERSRLRMAFLITIPAHEDGMSSSFFSFSFTEVF